MKRNSLIIALSVAIVAVMANYMAARHPLRLDLTQGGAYTLSDSTRRIVAGLSDVLTIRLYFSKGMPPALSSVRRDVFDLIAELKQAGGDRVQIEEIDPASSAMEEQKAAMIGIRPVQLNVYEGDRLEVARVFLGISVLYGTRQEVIPVVSSASNLEYELAQAAIKVSSESLPRIAWREERPPSGAASRYSLIKNALMKRYDIMDIRPGEAARLDPAEIKAVVLLSPRAMQPEEIFDLDQYIMKGGRALALVDRSEISDGLHVEEIASEAVPMLAHYGAEIEDMLVLDESSATAAFTGGPITYHIPYPYWPEVRGPGFNRAQPATANIESAVFPWTAPLSLSDRAKGCWIAESTQQATAVPAEGASLEPRRAQALLPEAGLAQQTIAALLPGPFASYFSATGRMPPKGAQVIAEGGDGARIFVTGSSRWIMDRFLAEFPQNAVFFMNALDNLSMSDELIGIRSREGMRRPIALMPDSAKAFLRYANVAAGPLALGAIGAATLLARRRRRKRIERRCAS